MYNGFIDFTPHPLHSLITNPHPLFPTILPLPPQMSASPTPYSASNPGSNPPPNSALPIPPSTSLTEELALAEKSSSLSGREVANLKERLSDALYDEGDIVGSLRNLEEALKVYEEYGDKRGKKTE